MNNGRYVTGAVTLREHINKIDQNAKADMEHVRSVVWKLRPVFRNAGYYHASNNDSLIREFATMIFETQDWRCTHWVEANENELNGMWNNPGTNYRLWKTDRLSYEIDHVLPMNSGGKDHLENIQFLTPNANRFTKCSMTYEDMLKRVDLSDRLKDRVRYVIEQRQNLFESDKWKKYINKLEKLEEMKKKIA